MASKRKNLSFVQLSEVPKTDGWRTEVKPGVFRMIPFTELTNEQLQAAVLKAEEIQLAHFNRSSFFGVLADKLIDEAEGRHIEVEHFNTDFTDKNVEARTKSKDNAE